MRPGRALAVAIAMLATGCGGVSHHLADGPPPTSIAVLPFAGSADEGLRDAARSLLHSRVAARGYLSPEPQWVDRVLSEHGWLDDAAVFRAGDVPVAAACRALGVDALLVTTGVEDRSFNLLALRRHRVGGASLLRTADGGDYWSAEHSAGGFGGFLLTSGQVLTELQQTIEHGSAMESLALADEWIGDVAGTLPVRARAADMAGPPRIDDAAVQRTPHGDGVRVTVTARATAGAVLTFDLGPCHGVPMVTDPHDATRHRGACDFDTAEAAAAATSLRVDARDRIARTARFDAEVGR
ncbi:MAG: hypothetical protein R3F29_13035 [Planctomycetota bacterium]